MSKKAITSVSVNCILLLIGVIGWVGISLAQDGLKIRHFKFKPTKTTKNVTLSSSWNGTTVIRVTGMQNTDMLNIRPIKELNASASVINIIDSELTFEDGKKMSLPQNGQAVSESALVVTEGEIIFNRPNITGKILIDVELPDSAEIQVYFNESPVLRNSSLYSPVSVRGGKVKSGYEFTGKALNRVMFPDIIEHDSKPKDKIVKVEGENLVFVPFSKLQVKSSMELPENSSRARIILEINEQGIVERAVATGVSNAQEIEQIMKQWQFVPFTHDGTPVKVKTFLMKD